MKTSHRILQLSSWGILFCIQVFFNINPTQDNWLRITILSSYMMLVSVSWIKLIEKRQLTSRLNITDKTIVIFTYSLSASILILFTKRSFPAAALIAGGSMILPVFEELFFRAYLLGSVSSNWPDIRSMNGQDRISFLKEGIVYLILSSLGFTLVHDDIIRMIITASLPNINLTIFFLRFLFGFTIGGLYYYTRSFMLTSEFHLIYNFTYIIATI